MVLLQKHSISSHCHHYISEWVSNVKCSTTSNKSFQAITCAGTDNTTRNNQKKTQHMLGLVYLCFCISCFYKIYKNTNKLTLTCASLPFIKKMQQACKKAKCKPTVNVWNQFLIFANNQTPELRVVSHLYFPVYYSINTLLLLLLLLLPFTAIIQDGYKTVVLVVVTSTDKKQSLSSSLSVVWQMNTINQLSVWSIVYLRSWQNKQLKDISYWPIMLKYLPTVTVDKVVGFMLTYHFIFRNFDNVKHVVDFSRVVCNSISIDRWCCCHGWSADWFPVACSHRWQSKCCNTALHCWGMCWRGMRWRVSPDCRAVSGTVWVSRRCMRTDRKSTWWRRRQARRTSKCWRYLMCGRRSQRHQTWHRQLRWYHLYTTWHQRTVQSTSHNSKSMTIQCRIQ